MEALTKTINEIMTKFIKRVASKYDLNQDEILEMWFEGTSTASRTVSVDGSGCPYVPSRGQNKGVVFKSVSTTDLQTSLVAESNTSKNFKSDSIFIRLRKNFLCTAFNRRSWNP